MKRFFSALMVALLTIALVSCASALDKEFEKVSVAMQSGNWEEVATLADGIYDQKDDCSAENIASLTICYQMLALRATDNATRYEYVQKFLDCYETGMEVNAQVMNKNGEVAGLDLASLAQQYKEMLPQFEALMVNEGE